MSAFFEHLFAHAWNHLVVQETQRYVGPGLVLGNLVVDGQVGNTTAFLPHSVRAEHIALLGRTGTGKSSLLKSFVYQDIEDDRGFAYFDLHGDAPQVLSKIAEQEKKRGIDLSRKVIVVDPADRERSVGINPLDSSELQDRFVAIAEMAGILKRRWGLEYLGARTEELLRNALLVLSEAGYTLVELSALLTDPDFRAACLAKTKTSPAREYFEDRYNPLSDAQQGAYRDAILNKVSELTGDPKFRHIVGQSHSTVFFRSAIDQGCWVIIKLDKGTLGEQSLTIGALFLSQIKNALFRRQNRRLFTIYADEVQNLVAFDSGLETLLSEARKFAVSVVSANQYLDQYPPEMRAAILSVNTQIFFRLSASDADRIANAIGGGRTLAERLKDLPKQHNIIKSGHGRWFEALSPHFKPSQTPFGDMYRRALAHTTLNRSTIETDIRSRRGRHTTFPQESLHGWE